ncbi:hypothetical protein PTKIN_Ptkin10aG0154600 [Pterospermum kingtungense]
MAIRVPGVVAAKQILRRTSNKRASTSLDVPKGFFAVYVEESEKKRFCRAPILPESNLVQRFAKHS